MPLVQAHASSPSERPSPADAHAQMHAKNMYAGYLSAKKNGRNLNMTEWVTCGDSGQSHVKCTQTEVGWPKSGYRLCSRVIPGLL